jgi:rubrerythrin
MDDLLALLEEEAAEDGSFNAPEAVSRDTARENRTERGERSPRRNPTHPSKSSLQRERPKAAAPHAPSVDKTASCVDTKVGIRMTNRKVSGAELLDQIVTFPFHSPAAISAMSLSSLNQILFDPATIVDAANVCGRTNLITVGIVFNNSGTRTTQSNGRAYCLVTMGNLRSGPAISVMLFGSAYTDFSQTCQRGKVVALTCPRLVPIKPGANNQTTTVMFTVNDGKQFQIIADARDFGICQHSGLSRSNNNTFEQRRCNNYIDVTQGAYCITHRKQALQTSNGPGSAVSGTTKKMEEVFAEHRMFQPSQGKTMTLPTKLNQQSMTRLFGKPPADPQLLARQNREHQTTYRDSSTNNSLQNNKLLNLGASRVTLQGPIQRYTQIDGALVNNSLLNPRGHQTQANSSALYGGIDQQPTSISAQSFILQNTRSNPYKNDVAFSSKTVMTKANVATPNNGKSIVVQDLLGIAKYSKRTKSCLDNKKMKETKRKVNLQGLGFDGGVLVPKRNRSSMNAVTIAPVRSTPQPKQALPHTILNKQRQLAERILNGENTNNRSASKTVASCHRHQQASTSKSSALETLFGVDDIDLEYVRSTKSKFEREAKAEDYAQSRNNVLQLEKQEEFKTKKEKQKVGSGAIEKEWICKTCNKTFTSNPRMCLTRGHQVQVHRKLQKQTSTDGTRLALSSKSADDGGLVLGGGLEWSWPNRIS